MTAVAPACPVDEAAIRALQDEAIAWLRSRGTDQWQNLRPARHGTGRSLADAISRGEVYIVRDGARIIGTVTVDDYADPEFWTPQDDPTDALYIHRMVVAREASGQDVGGRIIAWALELTRDSVGPGCAWMPGARTRHCTTTTSHTVSSMCARSP
ncbi:GNAT family N-acetyltransferase [Promicromonospora soli]